VYKTVANRAPFGSKELQRKTVGIENVGKEVCVSVWNRGIGSSFSFRIL
jgi:hypothetical protein